MFVSHDDTIVYAACFAAVFSALAFTFSVLNVLRQPTAKAQNYSWRWLCERYNNLLRQLEQQESEALMWQRMTVQQHVEYEQLLAEYEALVAFRREVSRTQPSFQGPDSPGFSGGAPHDHSEQPTYEGLGLRGGGPHYHSGHRAISPVEDDGPGDTVRNHAPQVCPICEELNRRREAMFERNDWNDEWSDEDTPTHEEQNDHPPQPPPEQHPPQQAEPSPQPRPQSLPPSTPASSESSAPTSRPPWSWWKCTTHGVCGCRTDGCVLEAQRHTQPHLRDGGGSPPKKEVRFTLGCDDTASDASASPAPLSSPTPRIYILPNGVQCDVPLSAYYHPWNHPGWNAPPGEWDDAAPLIDERTDEDRKREVDEAYAGTTEWRGVVGRRGRGERWVRTEKGDWMRVQWEGMGGK